GEGVVLRNNDVYGNEGGVNFKGVPDPIGTNGNISMDPLFVDPLHRNFRLQSGSPCIDAGDNSMVTPGDHDLAGSPRQMGAHIDFGAYEFLTAGPYGMPDAIRALKLAAGLDAMTAADAPLGAAASPDPVELPDALTILRKATGLS